MQSKILLTFYDATYILYSQITTHRISRKDVNEMFINLKNALENKKISIKAYAAVIGVSEKSVQNKINGVTPFTLPEVWKTCFDLFPEYLWSYLFSQNTDTDRRSA